MATRRTPVHAQLIERMDENDEIEEGEFTAAVDLEDSEEAQAFRKFAEEMRHADKYAKITVWREPQTSDGQRGQRKLTYLFECGLDQYEFSQIMNKVRDEYGSGIYRLQGRDPAGQMLFNRAFAVEAPVPREKPDAGQQPFNPTDLLQSFNNALLEQQQRMEATLARVLATNKPQSGMDQMQQMATMIALFKEMTGAFSGVPSAKPVSIMDELEKLTKLREALKGLSGEGGDGEGGEKNIHDTIGTVVETFAPMLTAGFQQMMTQNPRRALPRPQAQPTAGQPAVTPNPPPRQRPRAEGDAVQLSTQVAILVQNAKAGIDPGQMADTILSMTPDEKLEALKGFIESADVLDRMKAVNPAVAQFEQWFTAVRDSLRDYFKTEYLQDSALGDNLAPSDAPAAMAGDAEN